MTKKKTWECKTEHITSFGALKNRVYTLQDCMDITQIFVKCALFVYFCIFLLLDLYFHIFTFIYADIITQVCGMAFFFILEILDV